jgi:hypothetical protein
MTPEYAGESLRKQRKISTEVLDCEPDELGNCQAQIFGLCLWRHVFKKIGQGL